MVYPQLLMKATISKRSFKSEDNSRIDKESKTPFKLVNPMGKQPGCFHRVKNDHSFFLFST
jgi:hypothetical protein